MTTLRFNPQTRGIEWSLDGETWRPWINNSGGDLNALLAHYDDALAEAEKKLRWASGQLPPNHEAWACRLLASRDVDAAADRAAEALRVGRGL